MLPQKPPLTELPVILNRMPGLKTASANLREGKIYVKVPSRWPVLEQLSVAQRLVNRLLKRHSQQQALLQSLLPDANTSEKDAPEQATADCLSLNTLEALETFVRQLNAETFRLPGVRVKMGRARHSRLAQMNLRTRTMTVSCFCLHNVPEAALRYLIVHELAHLLEAGHTRRFWALVAMHCPDYRHQSRIIQAIHTRNGQKNS